MIHKNKPQYVGKYICATRNKVSFKTDQFKSAIMLQTVAQFNE